MLTWMHHCSVLQFPYPHWVWNSFWESLHILDSFQAKLRSHVRTRLTFLLWPQAWFASWSRLSPSLSLSRLVLKKIIPLSPSLSLSLSRLVLKKKSSLWAPLSLSLKVSVEKNHPSEHALSWFWIVTWLSIPNFPWVGPPQNGPHQVPKIGAKTQEIMRFSQTWGGPFGKV